MALGLSLRVSWICLLLLSSGACFPATTDHRYPSPRSGGGPAPGSNLLSEGSRPPLLSLGYEAAPHQPGSPTGNQPLSSVGAPSVAGGSSPSYEPNRFIVSYDANTNKPSAPGVPSPNAGYVSPPAGPLPGAPSVSVQPQPAGTSGTLNLGSSLAAYSPAYEPSPFPSSGSAYPAGNTAATYGSGVAPAYYAAAPATYSSGAAPAHYAAAPATYGSGAAPAHYAAAPATYSSGAAPAYYAAAPATYDSGAGPSAYGNPGLPSEEQPAGGAYVSFYDPSVWMPSRSFPDFSAWDANNVMAQSVSETSPLAPSSYIIQSRNGYQRAREVLSHMKYTPEYPEPPVVAYQAVKAPSKSPPKTAAKGGKKAY